MTEFDGRGVLVTGGALGIGRGIADAFARERAHVTIADIDAAAAARAVDEIRRAGGRAFATIGDVSSAEDAKRMVDEATAHAGRIDVLINNAGIQPRESYHAVDELPEETWDRVLAVNLKGPFLMAKYAVPRFRAAGGRVVVNIASVQGLQSMPQVPAYAASKGGLLSLTQSMALDYAGEGIRVVAVCPGTIDSELVRTGARREGGDLNLALQRYGSLHPIGRIGQPVDAAEAVVFLAGPRASFITGASLNVDGGLMALGAWASGAGAER